MARSVRVGACLVLPNANPARYGTLRFDSGRQMSAHRASYTVTNGEIPPGMVVRHTCDNPPCIEPTHLLIGTPADNERDKWERDRGLHGLAANNATVPPDVIREAVEEYLRGGVSQAEMASRFGVGPSTFGRWVRADARRRDVGLTGVRVGSGSRIATGLKPCGTKAGHERHRIRGEAPCGPCRDAYATYFRAYRAARKEVAS